MPLHRIPWAYTIARWFCKTVLKVFYGTIVVENSEYFPRNGEPCIVCANHGNSLIDGMLLVYSFEGLLRITAKSTLFGKPTLASWLVGSVCLPIKRRMDYPDSGSVDNEEVMGRLYQALGEGHSLCIFPEGASRYQPALSSFKSGVARIISEVLTRNRNNSGFEITLLTCSITYMQRQHFRSDVLISFNPPLKLKPQDYPSLLIPANLRSINSLTRFMENQISAGTLDAPSWDVIRAAKVAARIYSPLGTRMALRDYVKVTRKFMDSFQQKNHTWSWGRDPSDVLNITDAILTAEDRDVKEATEEKSQDDIFDLARDLRSYHAQLLRLGLRDDRIRAGPVPSPVILNRIILRTCWLAVLLIISLPGLILWIPVFASASYSAAWYARRGAPEVTWDEITGNKILVGLYSIGCVWIACTVFILPSAQYAFWLPCLMWMSLRWLEDAVSACRALMALIKILWVGESKLRRLGVEREQLRLRVMDLAVNKLGLPKDPETYFQNRGGNETGRVRGAWDSTIKYFSVRRRRKKAWDEILRIWPHDDVFQIT